MLFRSPEGNVISQSVVSGKAVEKGATITLVISLGKKSTYYSLNNFSINKPAGITEDATSVKAEITLYRNQEDSVINSWTATEFPFTINQGGIENCPEGHIVIKWEWHYLDEEGIDVVQTDVTEIKDVPFSQD